MRYEVPMLNVITTSLLLGFQKTKQYQLQYLLVVTCYCHSCSGNEYGLCLNGLPFAIEEKPCAPTNIRTSLEYYNKFIYRLNELYFYSRRRRRNQSLKIKLKTVVITSKPTKK